MAVNLPQGSTCIDFAYNIHTEVGHRAIRALVNQQNVPLSYVLNKGDVIKIVTTDYPKSPSYEWLNFAKTSFAKKKMKEFFKKESRASKVIVGRKMLQKEYDRAGLGVVSSIAKWRIMKFAQKHPHIKIESLEDVLVNIAEGTVSPLDFINQIYKDDTEDLGKIAKIRQKFLHRDKLIKFSIKVICETEVDLSKILAVLESKKNEVFLHTNQSRNDFLDKKTIVKATMFAQNYSVLSRICSEIEQVDGVKTVTRIFRWRRVGLIVGSMISFGVWALHPILLLVLSQNKVLNQDQENLLSNTILYTGLFILFALIFSLKRYTENSLPGLQENNRLWLTVFMISCFALATIFLEIYIYELQLNWILIIGLVLILFVYLTTQYLFFRSRQSR
jgi:hypothetical protein